MRVMRAPQPDLHYLLLSDRELSLLREALKNPTSGEARAFSKTLRKQLKEALNG